MLRTILASSLLMAGPLLCLPSQSQACDIVTSNFGVSSFSNHVGVQSFALPQTIIQQAPVLVQQPPVILQQAAPVVLQQQIPVVVENRINVRARRGLFGRRNAVNVNVGGFGGTSVRVNGGGCFRGF